MRVAFVSAVLLSLLCQLPASGRDIVIRFPRGSYCGSYTGNIRRGDSFRGKGQAWLITNDYGESYSVIGPDGRVLPPDANPDVNTRVFFTRRAGVHRVRIINGHGFTSFEFCAYAQRE